MAGGQDNGKYSSSSKRKHDDTLSDELLAMLKVCEREREERSLYAEKHRRRVRGLQIKSLQNPSCWCILFAIPIHKLLKRELLTTLEFSCCLLLLKAVTLS